MDGTRDRPPGKTAENWGRKDGIRAGSVSGPWRSAPRAEAAGLPAQPAPGRAPREPASAAGLHRPGDAAQRAPARRRPGMRQRIAMGALAALALVAAAVIFRTMSGEAPEPRSAAVAPAPVAPGAPQDAVPAPGVAAAAAPAPADPALAGVSVVRLRIGPEFPPEQQAAILEALAAAGITAVRVEALPFEIATSRVGYYREADLTAAEALGRLVTPVIAAGAEVGVRDYGRLLADPEPGRLDLWVGE